MLISETKVACTGCRVALPKFHLDPGDAGSIREEEKRREQMHRYLYQNKEVDK